MIVYLAAKYELKKLIKKCRTELSSLGIGVNSSWLNEPDGLTAEDNLVPYAYQDLDDIQNADIVIVFTELPKKHNNTKAHVFEVGYAYGIGKPILVVGEPDTIFYECLRDIRSVKTWKSALKLLKVVAGKMTPGSSDMTSYRHALLKS